MKGGELTFSLLVVSLITNSIVSGLIDKSLPTVSNPLYNLVVNNSLHRQIHLPDLRSRRDSKSDRSLDRPTLGHLKVMKSKNPRIWAEREKRASEVPDKSFLSIPPPAHYSLEQNVANRVKEILFGKMDTAEETEYIDENVEVFTTSQNGTPGTPPPDPSVLTCQQLKAEERMNWTERQQLVNKVLSESTLALQSIRNGLEALEKQLQELSQKINEGDWGLQEKLKDHKKIES